MELSRSHIIPEWCYRLLYEPAAKGAGREALLFRHGQPHVEPIQVGIREHLLCFDCEQRINVFEDYFSRVWIEERTCPSRPSDSVQVVAGLDYAKIKLFVLSVFWRASISTRDLFTSLYLGRHEDRIRQMIYDGDPGPADRYPFRAFLVHTGERVTTALIECPKGRARMPNLLRTSFYRMIFAGVMWNLMVTERGVRDLSFAGDLTEAGELRLESGGIEKIAELMAIGVEDHFLRGVPLASLPPE